MIWGVNGELRRRVPTHPDRKIGLGWRPVNRKVTYRLNPCLQCQSADCVARVLVGILSCAHGVIWTVRILSAVDAKS